MNTYRFNFSENFNRELLEFSQDHKFDDRESFNDEFNTWKKNNNNLIMQEERFLINRGYNGDFDDKMYKSVRYYFKNKSLSKKSEKKRKKYVNFDKKLLKLMDDTIKKTIDNKKPEASFKIFNKENEENELYVSEKDKMIKNGMNDKDLLKKIKKTYKNRYYNMKTKK